MKWAVFRHGLQTVHLWAGLILAIPFVLLGISGSILMLQPEVPRMAYPHAPARGEMRSIAHILDAAAPAAPEGLGASRVTLPQRPGEPAVVRYGQRGQRDNTLVFVDPVSLEVLGTGDRTRPARIFGTMRTLHATLYVDMISDRTFVGWIGIAIAALTLSGLVLWWPRKGQWKGAFGMKRGARGFRLNRDLHSTIGFWTLILYLVLCITGVYLAFPREFRASVGTVFPLGYNFGSEEFEAGPPRPHEQWLRADDTKALALAAVPDSRLINIDLASERNPLTILTLAPDGYGIGAPTITVSVDAEQAQIAYVDDPRAYELGERIVVWQRILHSGLGLGFVWKVLVFVSGFLPLLFAITGVRMWWLKRVERHTVRAAMTAKIAE